MTQADRFIWKQRRGHKALLRDGRTGTILGISVGPWGIAGRTQHPCDTRILLRMPDGRVIKVPPGEIESVGESPVSTA